MRSPDEIGPAVGASDVGALARPLRRTRRPRVGVLHRYVGIPANGALIVGMTLLGLSSVLPIGFMLINAFKTPQQWAASKIDLPSSVSITPFAQAWAATTTVAMCSTR